MNVSEVVVHQVSGGGDGLIAWASCVIDDSIRLNNIAVRRARSGDLILTYPCKRPAHGQKIHLYHPISDASAALLRNAILLQLGRPGDSAGSPAKG